MHLAKGKGQGARCRAQGRQGREEAGGLRSRGATSKVRGGHLSSLTLIRFVLVGGLGAGQYSRGDAGLPCPHRAQKGSTR